MTSRTSGEVNQEYAIHKRLARFSMENDDCHSGNYVIRVALLESLSGFTCVSVLSICFVNKSLKTSNYSKLPEQISMIGQPAIFAMHKI